MAKLQARLKRYRTAVNGNNGKSGAFLLTERHNSSRLGLFLRADGHPKPGVGWEAHHLISGAHEEAAGARVHLANKNVKIRIDDPGNGSWLPKERKFAWNSIYPNAIPHENIHRYRYYQWVEQLLSGAPNEGLTRAVLNTIRTQLLHGNVKKELLEEIHNAAYTKFSKKK